MVETVGHANGDLDAVVGCLEPRVGASEPDGPEDAGPASPDLLRGFDDPGNAAAGRPEYPVLQFVLGPFDRVPERRPEELPEPPRAVEPSLGSVFPIASSVFSCQSVNWSGFFRTAYLTPRMRFASSPSPARLAWFHRRLPTPSSASVIHETMRNPSGTRSAFGHHSRTHGSIHRAPSPATTPTETRYREHRSMPLRGRARISSTGSGRNGESAMRAFSTTVPLTLRSCLNMLVIRCFSGVRLSWSKTSCPGSAPPLLPQRLNDEPTPTKTAEEPRIPITWPDGTECLRSDAPWASRSVDAQRGRSAWPESENWGSSQTHVTRTGLGMVCVAETGRAAGSPRPVTESISNTYIQKVNIAIYSSI